MLEVFTKRKKGFTLIELLVVIAIIGLLSSIVLVSMGPARQRARDARRQSDARQVNIAMEMCYDDTGCGGGSEQYIDTAAGAAANTVITGYLTVPTDPKNSGDQVYKWIDGTTQYYCFYVALEGQSGTLVCASNKGVKTLIQATSTVTKDACCGMDTD